MSKQVLAGVDVGGGSIRIGYRRRHLIAHLDCCTSIPIDRSRGPKETMELVAKTLGRLLSPGGLGLLDVLSVGLATPGPINRKKGVMTIASNFNGWAGAPIVSMLQKALGGIPVVYDNDANTAINGCARQGVGQGRSIVAGYTLGTGIGGGIVIDNKVLRGKTDGAAELGHILPQIFFDPPYQAKTGCAYRRCTCGRDGCLEALVGGWAVEEQVSHTLSTLPHEQTSLREHWETTPQAERVKLLFDSAKAGDEFSRKWVEFFAEVLAFAVGTTIIYLDPDIIVFVGGMTKTGEWFRELIHHKLQNPGEGRTPFAYAPQIEAAEIAFDPLGSNAGWVGATYLAEEAL